MGTLQDFCLLLSSLVISQLFLVQQILRWSFITPFFLPWLWKLSFSISSGRVVSHSLNNSPEVQPELSERGFHLLIRDPVSFQELQAANINNFEQNFLVP